MWLLTPYLNCIQSGEELRQWCVAWGDCVERETAHVNGQDGDSSASLRMTVLVGVCASPGRVGCGGQEQGSGVRGSGDEKRV